MGEQSRNTCRNSSVCQCPPLPRLVVLHLLSGGVSKPYGLVKASSCTPHVKFLGGFSVAPPSRLGTLRARALVSCYRDAAFSCPLAAGARARSASLKAWQQPRGLWFSGSWLSARQGVRSSGQGTAAKRLLPSHLGEGWQSQSRTDAKGLNGECFKMLLRPHPDVTATWGLLLVARDSVCPVKAWL